MKQKLKLALAYTGLESCVYQSALLVHQVMLYKYIEPEYYGFIGAIFSLVYLATLYLNMGLDLSIPPLFAHAQQSYVSIQQLFFQLSLNICLGIIACMFLCIMPLGVTMSPGELFLCGLLILSETTKKTLKTVLHLLFFHRYIAIIEGITLGTYILIVWGCLLSGYAPSIPIMFAPLLLISIFCICLYSYPLRLWYHSVDIITQDGISWKKIFILRAQNFIYQISHSLYSPNFLVPIIAIHNIPLAGLLKMVTMVAYSVNNIIQHAFGVTSTVLFAYIKKQPLRYKQMIFHTLQRYLYRTTLILIISLTLHYYIIPLINPSLAKEHLYISYLFLLIICFEHIALMHEHFFIIEERTTFLILSNITLFIPIMLIKTFTTQSVLTLIFLVLSMRFVHLILVYVYGRYHWQLQIAWPVKPLYLSLSVTCILTYLFFA